MAEVNDHSEVKPSNRPPPFVEVVCKSSGKIRRFSAGTEAGFAVNLMNKKLLKEGGGAVDFLMASYIEAVKEGEEEPVSFGPNSVLVDYGSCWKLQTVVESNGYKEGINVGPTRVRKASDKGNLDDSDSARRTSSSISSLYIGKILLAFVLLFLFGAIFALVLENLPKFILYINSSI
ncbi:hypothetical protein ACJIZ3_025662 [Penstemon smallii]|uniref:Uncharacterized protein n=1 Tax=Penstemon smallii TaxID=265156 RepID=A0ABD3TV85_9LAMI